MGIYCNLFVFSQGKHVSDDITRVGCCLFLLAGFGPRMKLVYCILGPNMGICNYHSRINEREKDIPIFHHRVL